MGGESSRIGVVFPRFVNQTRDTAAHQEPPVESRNAPY